MPKIIIFNHVSLDGYFVDANGGMNWARSANDDAEWNAFVAENSRGDGRLLFGRITYQLMASFWPTATATKYDPIVARRMNEMSKVVFSKTLTEASWNNTKLVKGDLVEEVRKMKRDPGQDMAILGSGRIVAQLAQAGLVDEFQVVINPIVLGQGRTMFDGVQPALNLKLAKSRAFSNGNIVLWYEPVR